LHQANGFPVPHRPVIGCGATSTICLAFNWHLAPWVTTYKTRIEFANSEQTVYSEQAQRPIRNRRQPS